MDDFHFDIRPFREDDRAAFLALFEAAFNQRMDPSVWEWKYAPQPTGRRQIMACFHENGDMIAAYGGVPHPGRFGGAEGVLTQGTDQMCHPRYPARALSRRGFFVQTAEAFYEEFNRPGEAAVIYGFPGSRHFRLGEKLLRYVGLPPSSDYLERALPVLSAWKRWLPARPRRGVRRVTRFDESFDQLWQEAAAGIPSGLARRARYLNHRYMDGPQRDRYEAFSWSEGGAMRAFGIMGVMDRTARFMELFHAPDVSAEALMPLVARMLAGATRRGATLAAAWLPPQGAAHAALTRVGFVVKPEPLDFIYGIVNTRPELLEAVTRHPMYYTMGDADIF